MSKYKFWSVKSQQYNLLEVDFFFSRTGWPVEETLNLHIVWLLGRDPVAVGYQGIHLLLLYVHGMSLGLEDTKWILCGFFIAWRWAIKSEPSFARCILMKQTEKSFWGKLTEVQKRQRSGLFLLVPSLSLSHTLCVCVCPDDKWLRSLSLCGHIIKLSALKASADKSWELSSCAPCITIWISHCLPVQTFLSTTLPRGGSTVTHCQLWWPPHRSGKNRMHWVGSL